jgi:hypothetical protein
LGRAKASSAASCHLASCHPEERGISDHDAYVRGKSEISNGIPRWNAIAIAAWGFEPQVGPGQRSSLSQASRSALNLAIVEWFLIEQK